MTMACRSIVPGQLRRDHRLLNAHLTVLTSAASMAPETWLVLRNEYLTITKRLEDHARLEANVLALLGDVPGDRMARHDDRLRSLKLLGRFFVEGYPLGPLKGIWDALLSVAEGLREEIRLQNAEVLPKLERVLDSPAPAPTRGTLLHPEMTVERVLLDYPQARPVFDRLFVSEAFEAYDCLDEVAWRRGLSVEELLENLQQAIRPPAAERLPPLSRPW